MEREMRPTRRAVRYIEEIIRTLRGQKVILDTDLAALYGVETGALNRAVKRNARRFPSDFVFRLTAEEDEALRCQIGITKGKGGRRYVPNAFTEHGAVMAANVLNSIQAVDMSVFVVRAFVKMREQLLSRAELETRLMQIENVLLAHDDRIRELYRQIRPLLLPPSDLPAKPIGFGVRERCAPYRARKSKP